MRNYNLMGIVVENRDENAVDVQSVLTKYGSNIKTRVGLHDKDEQGNNEGFIMLSLEDNDEVIRGLIEELMDIEGVRVRNIRI